MNTFHLPDFCIDIQNIENTENDIKSLLRTTKPDWTQTNIEIKKLSGGFSCFTFKVCVNDNRIVESLIIRIRKVFKEYDFIKNTDFENRAIQILAEIGMFAKVWAIFQNGYCYQYIEGMPLLNLTTPNENIPIQAYPFREIANALAQIHSVKMKDVNYSVATHSESIKRLLKEDYPASSNPVAIEELVTEFSELRDVEKKFQQKIVLCHGDAHAGNTIWNKKTGSLTFVDWEMVNIGFPAYDIAYFLKILDWNDIMPSLPLPYVDISERVNIKKKFIRFYLQSWYDLNPEDASVLNDKYLNTFYKHVLLQNLMICLNFVVIFGAVSVKTKLSKPDDFPANYEEICKSFYKWYKANKKLMLDEIFSN